MKLGVAAGGLVGHDAVAAGVLRALKTSGIQIFAVSGTALLLPEKLLPNIYNFAGDNGNTIYKLLRQYSGLKLAKLGMNVAALDTDTLYTSRPELFCEGDGYGRICGGTLRSVATKLLRNRNARGFAAEPLIMPLRRMGCDTVLAVVAGGGAEALQKAERNVAQAEMTVLFDIENSRALIFETRGYGNYRRCFCYDESIEAPKTRGATAEMSFGETWARQNLSKLLAGIL